MFVGHLYKARAEGLKYTNILILSGMSVLEVIKNEKLISSANRVGKHLQKSLLNIKERYGK